jgi:DNA-binding winged helix-turn-helix (wHTH) protein
VHFYPTRFQLQLASGEQRIDLGYSGSRLLERLLQTPGEVVTREQLLQFAWADRVVGQGSLNQQVYVLRQVLGDEKERQIIQTLPRRGYLINPQYLLSQTVATLENPPSDDPQPTPAITVEADTTPEPSIALTGPQVRATQPDWQRAACLWACAGSLAIGLLLGGLLLHANSPASHSNGQLRTVYLGYDQQHEQALQHQGQAIEARLAQLVSGPTVLYITMNEEALALLCLQTGRSAQWLHIPRAELAAVSDAQLRQCLH